MVTADEIRRVALALPRASEGLVRESVKFRIGQIVFVSISADETTMGFGFPKDEREAMIAAEPHKFFRPRPSDLRYRWLEAWLHALEHDEMRELVVEAWAMCVPKRVVAEYRRQLT